MQNELIERREGAGSAYTVMAKRIDPDEHPAFQDVGYNSPTTIFTVWTDGGDAVTSHDIYEVIRELDGQNDWLKEDLHAMDDALRAADDQPDVDPADVLMDLARYYHTEHRKASDHARMAESPAGGAVHDRAAACFAEAADAARDTAQYVRGERDDRPTALVVGSATAADSRPDGGDDD